MQRFVYASSSSVYGDNPELPKVESRLGKPLSPYAATKLADEIYAAVFARAYGLVTIGLRYFNVFGPRQNPESPYAAVIPRWITAMRRGIPAEIFGDGSQSRDFCYVANVVQANLLAATTQNPAALNDIFNVGTGARYTLNELFEFIRQGLESDYAHLRHYQPLFRNARAGDIPHSWANIEKARQLLSYDPSHTLPQGLAETIQWHQGKVMLPKETTPAAAYS